MNEQNNPPKADNDKMKPTFLSRAIFVSALLTFSGSRLGAEALGTAFTFQGRLADGANAANGSYDFQFSLYDNLSGPSQVGPAVTNIATLVTNGFFTVPLDFGAGVFTGEARWLELAIRTNGGGVFTPLSPRQPLTPTPCALYATNAGFANAAASASAASSVPWSGLTGLPAGFADGVDNNTTYSAGVGLTLAGTVFTANFAGTGAASTVARSDHQHEAAYWKLGGNTGTSPGTQFLGTTDNQPLELKVSGQRVARLEPLFNAVLGFSGNSVAAGGAGNTIAGGASGFPNTIGATACATIAGGNANQIGESPLGVVGGGSGNVIQNGAAWSTVSGGQMNTIQPNASHSIIGGGGGNGIQSNAFRATIAGGWYNSVQTNAAYSTIAGGDHNTVQANANYATIGGGQLNTIQTNAYHTTLVGGGGNTIQSNSLAATLSGGWYNTVLAGAAYATIPGGRENSATNYAFAAGHRAKANHTGSFVWADSTDADFASAGPDQFLIRASGGVGVGTNNPQAALHVNGTTLTTVLTITGGADVAEPFEMSSQDIPHGALVVIDEVNPGQLKLSAEPYDKRVAGIVSGANGVNPGITLHQAGVMEGTQNVALSGRVYALADAANGPIRPGDLLTTSATPGHAMKVTDHTQAQGAIIGKAMTGLSAGKGLVLVLVTLQ
jgi:hypothetical protein